MKWVTREHPILHIKKIIIRSYENENRYFEITREELEYSNVSWTALIAIKIQEYKIIDSIINVNEKNIFTTSLHTAIKGQYSYFKKNIRQNYSVFKKIKVEVLFVFSEENEITIYKELSKQENIKQIISQELSYDENINPIENKEFLKNLYKITNIEYDSVREAAKLLLEEIIKIDNEQSITILCQLVSEEKQEK